MGYVAPPRGRGKIKGSGMLFNRFMEPHMQLQAIRDYNFFSDEEKERLVRQRILFLNNREASKFRFQKGRYKRKGIYLPLSEPLYNNIKLCADFVNMLTIDCIKYIMERGAEAILKDREKEIAETIAAENKKAAEEEMREFQEKYENKVKEIGDETGYDL